MGRDKATLPIDGVPMARRVADALVAAGADEVVCVGGEPGAIGFELVVDVLREGPLGGIALALRRFPDVEVVVVLGCDLLQPEPVAIRALVAALAAEPSGDVALPVVAGVRQAVHAAWRTSAAAALDHALASGDRAVQSVLDTLRVVEVPGLDPAWLRDADLPSDLG